MEITIRIRRDADGSTEQRQADVTRGGGRLNIHFREPVSLGERDVLMLDEEDARAALEGE
ncbi:MAG TPA: hypothetical protein VF668_01415 [Pyrinomonadaceae bacterium]|jgi:hypothetical protein